MSRLILTGIVTLSMVGCALTQPITDPSQIAECGDRPEQHQADMAAHAYTENAGFKDPDSVQIRNVRVDGPAKWNSIRGSIVGWQVSFDINAKNSYGAYTGYQRHEILMRPDGTSVWRTIPSRSY